MADKKCFIIMPITTPDNMVEIYRDGKDHFEHVLQTLFVPSVKAAGYDAIPPSAEGSDVIHANIIKNLETSDLVLCDTSCLNPNVFFEFGIRTSLNKPIAIVKDELTKKLPFDTGILQHHTYMSSLGAWEIESQRKQLTEHIINTAEKSNGINRMWKYFGIKTEAAPYHSKNGQEGQLESIKMQMEILTTKIDQISPGYSSNFERHEFNKEKIRQGYPIRNVYPEVKLRTTLINYLEIRFLEKNLNIKINKLLIEGNSLNILLEVFRPLKNEEEEIIKKIIDKMSYDFNFKINYECIIDLK